MSKWRHCSRQCLIQTGKKLDGKVSPEWKNERCKHSIEIGQSKSWTTRAQGPVNGLPTSSTKNECLCRRSSQTSHCSRTTASVSPRQVSTESSTKTRRQSSTDHRSSTFYNLLPTNHVKMFLLNSVTSLRQRVRNLRSKVSTETIHQIMRSFIPLSRLQSTPSFIQPLALHTCCAFIH